jgi:hypothetical protein
MKQKLRMIAMAVVLSSTASTFGQSFTEGSDAQSATADGLTAGFTVAAGTHIVSSGGVTIDYSGGDWINNGTISSTEGTLGFSGPVAYAGSGTTNIKDLKVAHVGESLLSSKITMTGSLAVSSGTLNANNNLTLVSNASGSAVIAPVASGSGITGKVTVERYIAQAKSAFRFLTPGVSTDDFISNNWQKGTHITGSRTGANGFDATPSGSPSLYTYDNAQAYRSGWLAIANTDATNLKAKQGYILFTRGDRDVDITGTSLPDMNHAVTLSATGTVVTGSVLFDKDTTPGVSDANNPLARGYSLIGNPYVNSVNWNTLKKTNITDTYYAWDPNMGTDEQRGRYVAYSTTTALSTSASDVSQYIQPGQSFWIKNSSDAAGSLTFEETDKTGIATTANLEKRTARSLSRLELQVYQTSKLGVDTYPIDAAASVFDTQFTNEIENGDVAKFSTGLENISFSNRGVTLAIDARPEVAASDELLVQLEQFKASNDYTFRTHFSNFDAASTPYLVDSYLDKYTALANDRSTDVAFVTTKEAASYDVSRFKIVFQKNTLSVENFSVDQILVYPNPVTNNQFKIVLPSYLTGEVGVKVINSIGQTVYETTAESQNTVNINPENKLSEGLYLVQITNQGKSITKKITIQ